MKKIVLAFLLILALALPVFAEGGTADVLIKAKVPSGTGTGDEGDITVGGVNIKIAYQEVKGEEGEVPSSWPGEPNMVTGAESKPEITADLVPDDADDTGCDALYLLVGVTGNPETPTEVTVSFDAPGWYSGTTGTGGQTVSNLELHCATTVTATSGNDTEVSASNDGPATGTDPNNKPIVITHAVGVQETPVLAGYAKLTWGITKPAVVNAGDYSTTITITITGDGESQTT